MQLGAISADAWLAFAFLVFIGSIVAFSAYAWLLRNVAISTVATYAYVNPVIAVVLGAVILDEEITAHDRGRRAVDRGVGRRPSCAARRPLLRPGRIARRGAAHHLRLKQRALPAGRRDLDSELIDHPVGSRAARSSSTGTRSSSSEVIEAEACEIAQPCPWKREVLRPCRPRPRCGLPARRRRAGCGRGTPDRAARASPKFRGFL